MNDLINRSEQVIIYCEYCTYWDDSGKCDYFSIPERNIEVHMDSDGFCSEAERREDECWSVNITQPNRY